MRAQYAGIMNVIFQPAELQLLNSIEEELDDVYEVG